MGLSITDAWIKAAVEHRVLRIKYYSERTEKEYTIREVDPDYVGYSANGKNIGLWASYDHFRREGPRVFKPDSIMGWEVTEKAFDPSKRAGTRWEEMIPIYKQRGLDKKDF